MQTTSIGGYIKVIAVVVVILGVLYFRKNGNSNKKDNNVGNLVNAGKNVPRMVGGYEDKRRGRDGFGLQPGMRKFRNDKNE